MEQDRNRITAQLEVPASWGDPARSFTFGEPLSVWQADTLNDVRPALERVATEQQAGRYVVGFLSYESAPAFDSAMRTPPKGPLPYAWFASYANESVFDSPPPAGGQGGVQVSSFKFQVSDSEYKRAVETALAHIRAGDIYQVNYTIRALLSPPALAGGQGGVSDLDFGFSSFLSLLAAAPMPHSAYLSPPVYGGTKGGDLTRISDFGFSSFPHGGTKGGESWWRIISLSLELFIRRRGNIIESRPMKGTAKREPSWVADEAARIALSRDEKNRAENVMIVDLVRNDLGRVCKLGSVTVPELWQVERFPTVHQMTSLVRGELRDDVSLFDIFAALFPPGSVTGAPKIRAMQIIAELEPEPRGIYCGTIGIFFPNGDFECNVAIRTIERSPSVHGVARGGLGLGSGIVADSDPDEEWAETQLKGQFVTLQPKDFILYETIRYDQRPREVDAHGSVPPSSFKFQISSFLDLHSHLRRLRQSCLYFGRPFPLKEIIQHLRNLLPTLGDDAARIKLDLYFAPHPSSLIPHPLIETQVVREHLSWPTDGMTIMLSDLRLDPQDFRLYHKTNLRPEKYAELEKAHELGATEVLFLNTRNELCEGALSNIALKINNEWLTPTLSCGLLPGTWREKQVLSGRWHEAILTLEDLHKASAICLGNAVRGEGTVTGILDTGGHSIQ